MCILSSELPVEGRIVFISDAFPHSDLRMEGRCVGNTTGEAFGTECAEFDLGHVEPVAMPGCEMELEFSEETPCFLRWKKFVECGGLVRIKVVEHHPDAVSIRVVIIDKRLHLLDGLLLITAFRDFDVTPVGKWFAYYEEVLCAVADRV